MRVSLSPVLPTILLACLLALAGCGSTPSRELPEPEVTLTNTYWKLVSLDAAPVSAPGPRGDPHLIFQDDGQVRGHTGCNILKGAYGQVDGQVRFLAMGATRMACANGTLEASFVAAMRDTRAMVIEAGQLYLKGENGNTLAVFDRIRGR